MKQLVLLVHHGTVDRTEDLPAFLKNVRRGREAPPELVAEMKHRYEAIGGSPLQSIASRIAAKLEAALGVPVRAAGRLWHPYPHEVCEGFEGRVVLIPLAQHSAQVYERAARSELVNREVIAAGDWGQMPALLDAFASRARAVALPGAALVLTAHSLPKGVDDAYERAARTSAVAIADRVRDVFPEFHVAFQSQGAGAGPSTWLGPTLVECFDGLRGRRVVLAPVGFLVDHVEILYDVDIEAKALAAQRGIELVRTASLNDSDDFVAILRGIAEELLSR